MVKEGQLLAIFNSAHRVMKAESVLKSAKLPVLLIPVPRQLQSDCGLALRFEQEHFDKIMTTLEQNDLSPFIVNIRNGKEYLILWQK